MWHKTPNLDTALALTEQIKASGAANWFRGQTRTWPVLSSFARKGASEQREANEHFSSFYAWIQAIPALEQLARDDDKILAVAQHYGLATNLVDFTTDPKVAAFFATHDPPEPDDGEDVSCIIYFNLNELMKVYAAVKTVRPEWPDELRAITLGIPDLLRIESQRGVFLEYPFDEGFERHIFGFDRIVFPTERNPAVLARLIAEEDIYPSQKSDLEILLDRYFMLRIMREGSEMMEEMARDSGIVIQHMEAAPYGIEAECFGSAGLPEHDSWQASRLAGWLGPVTEEWRPASAAVNLSIRYPSGGSSPEKIHNLQRQILEVLLLNQTPRSGPVKWTVRDVPVASPPIGRMMELVWDGLRRWPYNSSEIAQALATVIEYGVLVAQKPEALYDPLVAQTLAVQCLGDVLEIEVGAEDSSYTRGYANRELLRRAVRDDFFAFLTDHWRSQITEIQHILQIAFDPRRAFVFDRLQSLYCTQVVPTQVVIRGEGSGKARFYNPARATTLGLP